MYATVRTYSTIDDPPRRVVFRDNILRGGARIESRAACLADAERAAFDLAERHCAAAAGDGR